MTVLPLLIEEPVWPLFFFIHVDRFIVTLVSNISPICEDVDMNNTGESAKTKPNIEWFLKSLRKTGNNFFTDIFHGDIKVKRPGTAIETNPDQ
jgi:hypothetical protein